MPVDRSQFRALCRERPRRDLVAFVAGLEEARGRAVDRLDDGVVLSYAVETDRKRD